MCASSKVLFPDELNIHLRDTFRKQYSSNGYWCYSGMVTFKDGTEFSNLHPFKAYKRFKEVYYKYLSKHCIRYVCFPEISKQGRFHCHVMLAFQPNDYTKHEGELRLYKNFVVRRFGRIHTEERILNFGGDYQLPSHKRAGVYLVTTYEEKWKYLSKDKDEYVQLQYCSSI